MQEWKDAATILDEYLHFDEWKKVDEDPYYDWRLVKKVIAPVINRVFHLNRFDAGKTVPEGPAREQRLSHDFGRLALLLT